MQRNRVVDLAADALRHQSVAQQIAPAAAEMPAGPAPSTATRFPLPPALAARPKVTVRFEATNGNEIGAVFGVRTIRANGPR